MKKVLLATILASVAAVPAFAAGGNFRVEARAGYDSIKLTLDYDDGEDQVTENGSEGGIVYGAEIGYDFVFGGQFIGPYASFDLSNTKDCYEEAGLWKECLKARRNIAVGIRAGIGNVDSLRGYVKVGYVNGRIRYVYEDFEDSTENWSDSAGRGGLQVGAGIEYPFGNTAYGKVEYLYNDYKKFDIIDPILTGDVSRHQVVAGVGVRF